MIVSYNLNNGVLKIIENNYGKETSSEYCDYSGLYNYYTGKTLGPWMKLRYNKNSKILLIEQHMLGTPEPIYITERNNIVFISESLRKLKEITNEKYALNLDILPHFLYNGFLAGRHTLVKGVFKLPLGKRLIIEGGQIKFEDISNPYTETKEDRESFDYDRIYDLAIDNAIENGVSFLKNLKLSVALSAGYDSNCILYHIKKRLPGSIVDVYSVGGYTGVDETGNALHIANNYDNVSFFKATVTSRTLEYLDDIVSRLEGSVYERGVFLQYELAKLLKEQNCKFLVCGECADQVFNTNMYLTMQEPRFLFDYNNTPWEMAYYVVMRKSVTMLKSFGIDGIYPFVDYDVIRMGYLTRNLNGTEKNFHKIKCKEKLPPEISSLIVKQGGSTSLAALFEKPVNMSRMLEKCKYYDANYKLTQKYSKEESMMDYYLTLKYIESFERQFCDT